jgi:hypothetical protein
MGVGNKYCIWEILARFLPLTLEQSIRGTWLLSFDSGQGSWETSTE